MTGSHDRRLKLWDLNKGYVSKTLSSGSFVNALAATRDSYSCFSGHSDCGVRVWDWRAGKAIQEMVLHGSAVTDVALSYDSRYFVSASRDNTIKLVDNRTYDVVQTFRDEKFRSPSAYGEICFSPDASYVAAGSADGGVFIFNCLDGTLKTELEKSFTDSVGAVAWEPHGQQLSCSGSDFHIAVWS